MSRSRAAIAALVILVFAALGAIAVAVRDGGPTPRAALINPIASAQQTAVGFGERSHWLQPWRGYLDTPPATRLRDAIGINFNVEPQEAEATARLLQRSGFTRARVEIGWNQVNYENPRRLADLPRFKAGLLTFPWVGERAFHRGSGGQSPARLSIARAIRALALWKP